MSAIVRKSSCEHVSNSEWPPIQRYLNVACTVLPSMFSDASDFRLWGSLNDDVYKIKVDTPDELLARILDPAARIKKREDGLRRRTRNVRTRVAKCIEVDGGFSKVYCKL